MSIEAMKQALEWIEAQPEPRMIGSLKVITALSQAIKQQEQAQPYCYTYIENGEEYFAPPMAYVPDNATPLYTAPPRQPEQAQPVAWADFVETACALIKAADDAAADRDYMLDSDDCISVLRGTWPHPLANDCPTTPPPRQPEQQEPVAWTKEYAAINNFYGSRVAQRSQLKLMRHIDDGLHILTLIKASDLAKAAFCLHPIVQNSEPVDVSWSPAYDLACEYRDKANAYLCRTDTDWVSTTDDVRSLVGDMSLECRAMLIADKRQNYGDFIAAHYGKHLRSQQLDRYFRLWLEYLENYTAPAPRQPLFRDFIKWAGDQGYDCAQTCNSDTGEWICLNPVTADLWKAWQAARGIKGEA